MTAWQGSDRGKATAHRRWRELRLSILERDDYRCYLCGELGADAVDHKKPKHQGGSDHPSNLGAVHDRNPPHCHRAKTAAERPRVTRRSESHPGLL